MRREAEWQIIAGMSDAIGEDSAPPTGATTPRRAALERWDASALGPQVVGDLERMIDGDGD